MRGLRLPAALLALATVTGAGAWLATDAGGAMADAAAEPAGRARSFATQPAHNAGNGACPLTYYDLWTLHAEFIGPAGVWVTQTRAGRLGVDGGLMSLQDC